MTTKPKPLPASKLHWRVRVSLRTSLGDCRAVYRFPHRDPAKKFIGTLPKFWTVIGPTRIRR